MTHYPKKNAPSLHTDPSVFLLVHCVLCVLGKALKPSPGFPQSFDSGVSLSPAETQCCFPGTMPPVPGASPVTVYLHSVTKASSLPLGIDLQFSLMPWGDLLPVTPTPALCGRMVHFAHILPRPWLGTAASPPPPLCIPFQSPDVLDLCGFCIPLLKRLFLTAGCAFQAIWKESCSPDRWWHGGFFGNERDTSDREHEEFNEGTDGHGHSGNLWQVFIWPFQFLGDGRGSLEKISAQLYIFIIHMLNGILNVIASNFPPQP